MIKEITDPAEKQAIARNVLEAETAYSVYWLPQAENRE